MNIGAFRRSNGEKSERPRDEERQRKGMAVGGDVPDRPKEVCAKQTANGGGFTIGEMQTV